MRHRRTVAKLGRTAAHRKAMFRNMVTSLFQEERVETTVAKAKEARRVAERVITYAKRGDIHARRQAARIVRNPAVLRKLFEDIGPRFAERPGGYTRIMKTGFRDGDNAPMSILELLSETNSTEKAADSGKKSKKKTKAKTKPKTKSKSKSKAESKPKAKTKSKSKSKSKSKTKAKAEK
jgi:large subunit ribosomal protein L17